MMKYYRIGAIAGLALAANLVNAGIILQESFDYPDGSSLTNANPIWQIHSGTNQLSVQGGAAWIAGSSTVGADVNATLTNFPYAATGAVAAVYAKFTVDLSSLPTATEYFAHFYPATFNGRVYAVTAGADPGNYFLAVANGNNIVTNFPLQLTPGTPNTVVVRQVPAIGLATLWVNPVNETSTSVINSNSPVTSSITGYALRQANNQGVILLDNLIVGTSFADVIPSSAGQNPPFVAREPQDVSVPNGTLVSLAVVAGGDAPTYQWRKDGANISGATGSAYSFSSTLSDSGGYSAVIANSAGSITSRTATVTITPIVIAPTITTNPATQTAYYNDNVVFSVGADGSQPFTYQWLFNGTNLPGATAAFYTVSAAQPADAGPYRVIVSNSGGSATSAVATLTVSPPPATSIAALRAMLDPVNYRPTNTTTRFTAEGIVTTWNNLTGGTNALFYIQDNTAGMGVFHSGGAATRPKAGDRVRITARLGSFNGLFQFTPSVTTSLDSVTVLSTNNPLPTATAVPFDASQTDTAVMENLEGRYMVASNVFLANPASFLPPFHRASSLPMGWARRSTCTSMPILIFLARPSPLDR